MLDEEEEKYLEEIFSNVRENRTVEIWDAIKSGNMKFLQESLYEPSELYREVI